MPGQKRRRFLIRRKAKERKARQKQTTLTPEEMERIRKSKDDVLGARDPKLLWKCDRTLREANNAHRTDLFPELQGLAKAFPKKKIRVLVEGAGISTYGGELVKEAEKKGIDVELVRTDINSELTRNGSIVPEDLIKRFGRDSFHMVISTHGGVSYTEGNQKKAFTNVVDVLKPGGVAHVLVEDNAVPRKRGTLLTKESMRPLLKHRKNVHVDEDVVTTNYGKGDDQVSVVVRNFRIKKHKS